MKASFALLLVLLGSALTTSVPETEQSKALLYPYGKAEGDAVNPKDDDGTSPEVPISKAFIFYGKTYRSLYVNNNGVVSFSTPVPEYTPKAIPLTDGKAFVAPYWGDVNNVLGGDVFYREIHKQGLLDRLTRDLNTYFPKSMFITKWAFVATWDHVAYFGSMSQRTNTFQAVLGTDGKSSYMMLNYGDIQWTTGAASGGDRMTGQGGYAAQAGFNSGDDKNFYSMPGSRTPSIINITKTSNVHVPGRWVFQVDNGVTGVPEKLLPKKEGSEVTHGNAANHDVQGPQEEVRHESLPATGQPGESEQHIAQGHEVTPEVQRPEDSGSNQIVPVMNRPAGENGQDTQSNGDDGTATKKPLEEKEDHAIQGNEVQGLEDRQEFPEQQRPQTRDSSEESDECEW